MHNCMAPKLRAHSTIFAPGGRASMGYLGSTRCMRIITLNVERGNVYALSRVSEARKRSGGHSLRDTSRDPSLFPRGNWALRDPDKRGLTILLRASPL